MGRRVEPEFRITYHQIDERGACEFLGFDYDELVRYREERATLDPDVLAALDEVDRATQRAVLFGPCASCDCTDECKDLAR